MRAYFIGQFDIHDPAAYAAYRAETPATIARHGGRFIVRGGRLQSFEGEPPLPRVVVIEFPSFAAAEAIAGSSDRIRLFEPFGLASTFGPVGRVAVQLAYWGLQARDFWREQR